MKKAFVICLALLFTFGLATSLLAQAEKAKAPEKPAAAPEKPAAEKAAKPKVRQFTGEVVKADASAIVVKSKKVEKTFDVSEVKGFKPEDFKEGEKVVVKYVEKEGKLFATSVKKVAVKKEAPKEEKPVEKPAPPKK